MKSIAEMTYLELEREIIVLKNLSKQHGKDKYRTLPKSHFARIEELTKEQLRRVKALQAEAKAKEKERQAKLNLLNREQAKFDALSAERRSLNLETPEGRKRLSQILAAQKRLYARLKSLGN